MGTKYIEGWADYDYGRYGDQRHNESSGDRLRRDLAKFKSLKEVLLSHNGADGGLDRDPGRIELLDYGRTENQAQNLKMGAMVKLSIFIRKTCCPWSERKGICETSGTRMLRLRNDMFRR